MNMQVGFQGSFIPFYNPLTANNVIPNVTTATAASHSCLTFNNGLHDSRKRPRDTGSPVSFLGGDISIFVQHQLLDIDGLINQHNEEVRMELTEQRKRFLNQVMMAVEDDMSKRLKGKQEEIDKITKLNWAFQERIKSLLVENQVWKELAESNEATANMLRSNLEHALAAHVNVQVEQDCVEAAGTADNAESCCYGDNWYEKEEKAAKRQRRNCVSCQSGEPAVVLLPCRHLCLCAACETVVYACPVCNSRKAGTVFVNML